MEEIARKARAEVELARNSRGAVHTPTKLGLSQQDDAASVMGKALSHMAQVLRPTQNDREARQAVIDDLNRVLAGDQLCAGLHAVAYGSSVYDFDLPGSDLDNALGGHLTLLVPSEPDPTLVAGQTADSTAAGLPHQTAGETLDSTTPPTTAQPETNNHSRTEADSSIQTAEQQVRSTIKQASAPKSLQQMAAEAWSAGNGILGPWHYAMAEAAGRGIGSAVSLEALSPPEIRRLLLHIADALEADGCVGPQGVLRVLDARVPILKYKHVHTAVPVDVCCGARGKAFKGLIVAQLNRLCPLLPPLFRLVKLWAQMHSLNDASDGTFNSWSLTLMAIFALQTLKPAQLPPLWQTLSAMPPNAPATSAHADDQEPLCPAPAEPTAGQEHTDDEDDGPPLLQASHAGALEPSSVAAPDKPLYSFDVEVDEQGEVDAAEGEDAGSRLQTIKETDEAGNMTAIEGSGQAQDTASDDALTAFANMQLTDASTAARSTAAVAGTVVQTATPEGTAAAAAGCDPRELSLEETAAVVGPDGWRLLAHPRATDQQLSQALSHCTAWCTRATCVGWGSPVDNEGAGLLDALHWFFSLFYHLCDGWQKGWLRHQRVSVWHGQLTSALWPRDYLVGVEEPFDATDNTARSLGTLSRNAGSLPYIVYVLSTSLQLITTARTQRTLQAVQAALAWLWGEEGIMALSEPLHQQQHTHDSTAAAAADMQEQKSVQQLPPASTEQGATASTTSAAAPSTSASMLVSLAMDADELLTKMQQMLDEGCPPVQVHNMLVEKFGGPTGPLSLQQWHDEQQQKQAQEWVDGEQGRQQDREAAAAYWASLSKQADVEKPSPADNSKTQQDAVTDSC